MKNPTVLRLLPVFLLAAASTAFANPEIKKEIVIRRGPGPAGSNFNVRVEAPGHGEMEKVAYLGVETQPVDPTVAAQLGLPRGTGVVVRRVAEGSPAANLLQPHDVLTKIDDQILVNMGQLTVLVRNHKVGDEVKLTYIRSGKEATAKAKLGEREVPKLAWEGAGPTAMQFFSTGEPGGGNSAFSRAHPAMPMLPGEPGIATLATPAHPPGEPGDVMRVIGGDRMHWFSQPRVHVLRRHGGAGSTILDLAAGNFVFSDDAGSVEVNATNGKRELTVKDKAGKVTFQGPINTPEEHSKLPVEVKARIDAIGGAELGAAGEGLEIETKVLEPGHKIRFVLPGAPADDEVAEVPAMRTL